MRTIPNLLLYAISLINDILVPVIFTVAFFMFLVGVYRFFIASAGDPEKVQEGQKFVMWSLIGFFVMFSIWGLVNILINTLGFGGANMPAIPSFDGSSSGSSYGTGPYGNYGSNPGGTSATPSTGGTSAVGTP